MNNEIQSFLKDNMEKYKLENAIIIIPFSNDSKTALLDKLNDTESTMIAHVEFDKRHVERHPAVSEVLKIYQT